MIDMAAIYAEVFARKKARETAEREYLRSLTWSDREMEAYQSRVAGIHARHFARLQHEIMSLEHA